MDLGSYGRALGGGVLIGAAASILLVFSGKVAGISGIVAGLLPAHADARDAGGGVDRGWRWAFLLGLLLGGALLAWAEPGALPPSSVPTPVIVVAGLLVGVGTTVGNGCTSGHGVCGISRLSLRSIVATVVFIAAGMTATFLLHRYGTLEALTRREALP